MNEMTRISGNVSPEATFLSYHHSPLSFIQCKVSLLIREPSDQSPSVITSHIAINLTRKEKKNGTKKSLVARKQDEELSRVVEPRRLHNAR